MSKDFFKVKKGLNLEPRDLTTIVDAEIGDIAVDEVDGKLKQYDGSGFREMGGSGQGGINYLEGDDTNFELSTGNWVGDTNLVISQETVSPLRGDGSLKISKGAVDASSQEVTTPVFTVDDADLASVIVVSFDYDFSDSNYSDGDARIEIEFDPNGTPSTKRVRSGEDIKGGKGTHYASFQTDATITDYKVKIVWQDTGTSAVEAYIDNVIVGPNDLGALVNSEDLAYIVRAGAGAQSIANGNGEVVSLQSFPVNSVDWVQDVGNRIKIYRGGIYLVSASVGFTGGASSGRCRVVIRRNGSNFLADSKNTPNNQGAGTVGTSAKLVELDAGDYLELVFFNDSGVSQTIDTSTAATYLSVAEQPNTASILKALGGSEVYVEALALDGSSVLALGDNDLSFNSVTEGSSYFDGTTFTVPESGVYLLTLRAETDTTTAEPTFIGKINVNGSSSERFWDHRRKMYDSENDRLTGKGTVVTYFNKGDLIKPQIETNTSVGLNGGEFKAYKLGATGTVGADKVQVAARYRSDSGQSITSGVDTTYIYEDKIDDTHGAYNTSTGEYTIPLSGWYSTQAKLQYDNTTFTIGTTVEISLQLDGVVLDVVNYEVNNTNTTRPSVSVVTHFYAEEGQVLVVNTYHNEGSPRAVRNNATRNTFSIVSV